MKRSRRAISAGLAAVTVAAVFAAGAPTAAADSSTNLSVGGKRVASGGFESYDEIFWTVDQAKDGHSVAINWTASSKNGKYFTCWNPNGAASGAKSCDDSIKEGARVKWRLCTGEYSSKKLLKCTGWLTDYA